MAEQPEDHEDTTVPHGGGEASGGQAVLLDLGEQETPSRRFYANLAGL